MSLGVLIKKNVNSRLGKIFPERAALPFFYAALLQSRTSNEI